MQPYILNMDATKKPKSKIPTVEAILLARNPDQKAIIRKALEEGKSMLRASQMLGVSEKMIRDRCKADPTLLDGIERCRGKRPQYV